MLAREDISIGHPTVTCRKVLPNEFVRLGNFAYSRTLRYLIEALIP